MLYDNRSAEQLHYEQIGEHYEESDRAEKNYNHHHAYEPNPLSSARDAYGREVPHDYRPAPHPYPYQVPDPGHYSAEYGEEPPAYRAPTPGRHMNQRERRAADRRLL
ncbi:MAG: hypothetical protein Q9224_006747 [Gallowayella concinna]